MSQVDQSWSLRRVNSHCQSIQRIYLETGHPILRHWIFRSCHCIFPPRTFAGLQDHSTCHWCYQEINSFFNRSKLSGFKRETWLEYILIAIFHLQITALAAIFCTLAFISGISLAIQVNCFPVSSSRNLDTKQTSFLKIWQNVSRKWLLAHNRPQS